MARRGLQVGVIWWQKDRGVRRDDSSMRGLRLPADLIEPLEHLVRPKGRFLDDGIETMPLEKDGERFRRPKLFAWRKSARQPFLGETAK